MMSKTDSAAYSGQRVPQETAPTTKQVYDGLGRLERAQAHQQQIVENLDAALQSVLRNGQPRGDGKETDAAQVAPVPLASTLFDMADRAERMNDTLISILDRLEI